jgi:signal transduction histidine kinase
VAARFLSTAAETSRALVTDMSDIVWAVNPRHDDLGSLFGRITQFGSDLMGARGIDWQVSVDDAAATARIDPESRRHLLLLLKEAVNNIAKHANCRRASLDAIMTPDGLRITVFDDGQGFRLPAETAASGNGGNGVSGMRARASEVGGSIAIHSGLGGTRLTVVVPLRRRRWLSRVGGRSRSSRIVPAWLARPAGRSDESRSGPSNG